MELDLWAQTQEGKLAIAEQTMSKEEMLERAHQYALQKMDQDTNRKKLQSAMQYVQMASQVATGLSNLYTMQMNKELKAAGDNEEKKEAIQRKYAVKQQNVAVMQAIMNGALSVMSMWANAPNPIIGAIYTAIVAGVTAAEVGVIKSQQFADGRYPVKGIRDGKTYQATLYGKPTTTEIVRGPALVSEIQDEMIVDGPTTRNLVFNYPHIVEGIKQLSMGGVPQFAGGRYPVSTEAQPTTVTTTTDPAMMALMERMMAKLDEPAMAILSADENYMIEHNKIKNKYEDFTKRVSG